MDTLQLLVAAGNLADEVVVDDPEVKVSDALRAVAYALVAIGHLLAERLPVPASAELPTQDP